MNVITTASAARSVKNRSPLPFPRSAPAPGYRPHPTENWFYAPTNQVVSPCRPGPLTRRRPPSEPRMDERRTAILPLPEGEGRGEGEVPNRTFGAYKPLYLLSNLVWFVGSNVNIPANEGLYPLANAPFLLTSPHRAGVPACRLPHRPGARLILPRAQSLKPASFLGLLRVCGSHPGNLLRVFAPLR
jgi:hypothetical protein